MFLALTDLGEKRLLVLGLSAANRQRLADGEPIFLTRETHGLSIPADLKIVIFAGDTEASMREGMASLIGPTTVVDQTKEH